MQTVQGSEAAPAPLLAGARQLVTKGQAAELLNVTAGRVSQYIKEGKIFGDAIVGQGRNASIDINLARQQLGRTLDPVQLSAQARPTPAASQPAAGTYDMPPLNDAQQRTLLARAEQAEIAARRAKREEEAQKGVYMLTEDAVREWSRAQVAILASLDELMPTMGDALAAEFRIDPKLAVVILRRELRAWRARQAAEAQSRVAAESDLVEEAAEAEESADA